MKSRLSVIRNNDSNKDKPYLFCARIKGSQISKLNALIFGSGVSHTDFINSILNIIDWRCRSGEDDMLRAVFGHEFYMKFIEDYLDNLYKIETAKE